MAPKMQGILPPMATPFTADEELDLAALKANITAWNQTGLGGYLAVGSNGESVYMSAKEQDQVVAATAEAAAEDKLVMAGTGRESTRETIAATNRAAGVGAHCALVVTPHYFKGQMKPERLKAHYLKVAEAAKIPVLLYNVPQATGVNMEPDTVVSLCGHPNIVGIKDSSGNVSQLSEILRQTKDEDFKVFVGSAEVIYSAATLGVDGGILGVCNVLPQRCVELFEAAKAGDHDRAKHLQWRIAKLAAMVTRIHGVGGLKATMDMVGYQGGVARMPLAMPSPEVVAELKAELAFASAD
ncbi:MAG: dihydrodipicolinate synthase family protein [Desulfarculaceae bacterium]|nr:dihydrodipicolinate synthase family protein [Desulfarculaceae bacterium]MCF8073560.1 dihydrodipicolinate synthase family protein [Desulfarculaceae bacterium]MCF8103082.1 dihydrodipicolinate synthase family protein [Desulfarculaceae bacterium]MCF8115724.1 dihydrodipicolinate synthase family protein [Desulfarculaceae bacterium]